MAPVWASVTACGFAAIIIPEPGAAMRSAGSSPSTGGDAGWMRVMSASSSEAVRATDRRVRTPVSAPSAIAATPASTAMPSTRRIHSPTPSERLSAVNTRPPTSSTTASEVAAPAA